MAQLPTTVVYDVQSNPAGDSLRVYLTPVGAGFNGLASEIKFTIRWPETSPAMLTAAGQTQYCPGGYNLSMYQGLVVTAGGFKYATYTAFGLQFISVACPSQAWQADVPKLLITLAVTGNTGCTPFNIADDLWAFQNGREPYVELDGQGYCSPIQPVCPFGLTIDPTPGYIGDPNGACAVDCNDVVGGPAVPGTACDDLDPCTTGDVFDAECDCVGTLQDADQDGVCDVQDNCPTVPGQIGSACDDGDACTTGDALDASCDCVGTFADADGDGTCDAEDLCPGGPEPGTACNDGDDDTEFDQITANCTCVGTPVGVPDCEGTIGGPAQPGTPCDDDDVCTINDLWDANCDCVGTFQDTDGDTVCDANDLCPGGPEPGTSCNDGDPCTTGDVIGTNCLCAGTFADSDGDGTCDANDVCANGPEPGTPCNDGDDDTEDDEITANCECVGTPVVVTDCEGVPNGPAVPGTPCDDGNVGTGPDTWSANCICSGPPIGGCTENMTIELQTDANGNQTTWEILAQGSLTVMCNGGGYPSNATATGTCCVPEGCYILRVYDSAGDGMASGTNGGYILRTSPDNERIIDNRNNFLSGSVSAISGDQAFCLPLGTDKVIYTSCDKLDWVNNQFIVASPNPAVSAEWIPGGSNSVQDNNSGYQFWFYDPNGSYSFVRFRTHNQPDGFGNVGATRAAHMQINNWALANHIPTGVLMNVRVRGVVNGVPMAYGPACRFKIDPVAAQCPVTKLMDIPGNQFLSCGQYRQWAPGSYAHARPVSGASAYQFRFRQPAEGYEVVRTVSAYFVQLYWSSSVGAPLVTGSQYEVDVRAYKNGQWCPWGDICTLNIGTPVNGGGGVQSADIAPDAEFSMWPNPNRGDQLYMSLNAVPEEVLTVTVDLFDMFGKRVMARTIATQGGFVNTVLDLNGELAAGMYMVNITAGDKVTTERLVIQP